MTTKEQMLDRIRSALSDRPSESLELPPVLKVWEKEGLSIDEMARRFRTNLEAVQGEVVPCRDLSQAVQSVTKLLDELGAGKIAVMDRPLCREVADRLEGKELMYAPSDPGDASPADLAETDAGLVSPEYLMADTGSCLFSAPVAFDRLCTYITPISFVVASRSMLRENTPEVWEELKPRLESARTGEMVIVTGPSRTADIEKILVLGVHGPKRLIVLLID